MNEIVIEQVFFSQLYLLAFEVVYGEVAKGNELVEVATDGLNGQMGLHRIVVVG